MNQPLRCFIIDDEPPARELIEKYIRRVPFLELVGTGDNAVDALFQVQQVKPDLIFLDVEMPEMTGFEFLRLLPANRPPVIMVTAYPQYAVEGFEHQVADYLLKPVSFERFMKAINKVVGSRPTATQPESLPTPPVSAAIVTPATLPVQAAAEGPDKMPVPDDNERSDFLLVKEDKKLVRVVPDEIMFVEGMKDYLKLHLLNRVLVTHMTMTKIEDLLPTGVFLRVNRSYIVRKGAIREIDGNQITTTDGKKVPIGVTYREAVLDALRKNRM